MGDMLWAMILILALLNLCMKKNDRTPYQNPCRDFAMQRLYIWIYIAIGQNS